LELLGYIGDPALAEALPGQEVDAARAEQRPQRHLDGARIGGRHDADPVIGGQAEHGARAVDDLAQLRLAGRAAMRAPETGIVQRRQRPTRTLGTWTRGEMRS